MSRFNTFQSASQIKLSCNFQRFKKICEWATPRGAKITFQNVFIHRSWLVELTSLPHLECWVPDNFQAAPKNSSLPCSLDFCFFFIKKIKQKTLCSLSLTSPCLASFCSEKCLKCCITSTSCDCLSLYTVSLIVFLNCKSLWIKASAKWINVNVKNIRLKI